MRSVICIKECLSCNKSFNVTTKNKKRKFCSVECSVNFHRNNETNQTCPICGKKFYRKKSAQRSTILTCSVKCAVERKRIDNLDKYKNCPICGNLVKGGRTKFCSQKCRSQQQINDIKSGDCSDAKTLRNYYITIQGNKCEECNLRTWLNKPIKLELHHLDGNSENNNPQNLKLLCPNCHSMTPTWKSKNLGSGRFKRQQRRKAGLSA